MRQIGDRKLGDFLKWFFAFDAKDIWNWILLALAIYLLWWGISNIIAGLKPIP